jgi:hypothetical protein
MDCPLCGESIPEGAPQFYITLSSEDESSGSSQDDVEVCEQCFNQYQSKLF